MGNLFLQGGGSYPKTTEMDRLFFEKIDKKLPILYIPTAMLGDEMFTRCYSYFSELAKKFTNQEIVMWTEIKNENLQQFGGIYIGGGNTYKLLQDIQNSQCEYRLKEYLEQDGTVCGGSAGAIIFGKNIDTSRDSNIVNLRNTEGLNMIHENSLWCHYGTQDNDEIYTYIKHHKTNVIALKEDCGLMMIDNVITPIGDVLLFSQDRKVPYTPLLWQTEKS